ncbi:hypothetical protein QAD02_006811 [Eretmocerus hayati]|uniref:Uncharacterized protein n=1 Tax=Eretmocerus hayati TaxID=131215 RepID=A0ACC2N4B3_9HYME|nr:hypothetical protein QAD02_006811 [Eretmocerus hayati]
MISSGTGGAGGEDGIGGGNSTWTRDEIGTPAWAGPTKYGITNGREREFGVQNGYAGGLLGRSRGPVAGGTNYGTTTATVNVRFPHASTPAAPRGWFSLRSVQFCVESNDFTKVFSRFGW